MLTLRLLGTTSIDGSEGHVTGRVVHGRQLALLALLALARGRVLSRDKLVALLWPDAEPDRARPHLSNALYILRGALGEDVVRAAGDGLLLNSDVITSDVTAFEDHMAAQRLDQAVRLYRGPLLDGFHLPGSNEFEDWRDAERLSLAALYASALESLAADQDARGDFGAAAEWWRRRAAHDPCNSRVALRLMSALDAAGDRAAAIQHARTHARLLREEFDAEPDIEVAALAERLRRDATVRPASLPRNVAAPDVPHASTDTTPTAALPVRSPADADPAVSPPSGIEAGSDPSDATAGRARLRSTPAYARWSVAVVLMLVLVVLAVYGAQRLMRGATPSPVRSIAVLPFVNMSADPAHTYFSDGLSEQVIAALSGIDGLSIAARTSSFALRDRQLSVRAIGETLGVHAVLEGSMRTDGQRVQVTAQLVDARTGYQIWTEQYDGELDDMMTVQDRIAHAIAGTLELRLAGVSPPDGHHVPSLEAYDLYLRGLFLRNSMSEDALRAAVALFERAIELEPDFAAAAAANASVIATLVFFGHQSQEEGLPEVRAQTARALELDPTLGEAHAALAMVQLFFDWNWQAAERSLARAIELNPSDPHAWHHLANLHRAMGDAEQAITARERAVALDPLNARSRYILSQDYSMGGRHELAIEQARRAARLDAVHPLALGLGPNMPRGAADVYLHQGRHAEAVAEYVRIAMLRGASAVDLGTLNAAYVDSGMSGFWRSWAALDTRLSTGAPNAMRMAAAWALADDTARALEWLELAWLEHNPGLIFIAHNPPFERLRAEPRFQAIIGQMDFPGGAIPRVRSRPR